MENQKDIESDYWKDIFRHLQHRNMSRIQAMPLLFTDAMSEIDSFKKKHLKENFTVEDKGSSIVFEVMISQTIKFRLFIQNQIKGTLLQKNAGEAEWVKIADAKFPNNPFPEVEVLLLNQQKYENELNETKKAFRSECVSEKIAVELIKAFLMKKFSLSNEMISVKSKENKFLTHFNAEGKDYDFSFSKENFLTELKEVQA